MTYITKLPEEPIVIVRLNLPLHLHPDDVRSGNTKVARIARLTSEPLYLISDLSHPDMSFSDILLWLMDHSDARRGSIFDPAVYPLIVGASDMARIAAQKAQHHRQSSIPIFPTVEEAVAFARSNWQHMLDAPFRAGHPA